MTISYPSPLDPDEFEDEIEDVSLSEFAEFYCSAMAKSKSEIRPWLGDQVDTDPRGLKKVMTLYWVLSFFKKGSKNRDLDLNLIQVYNFLPSLAQRMLGSVIPSHEESITHGRFRASGIPPMSE